MTATNETAFIPAFAQSVPPTHRDTLTTTITRDGEELQVNATVESELSRERVTSVRVLRVAAFRRDESAPCEWSRWERVEGFALTAFERRVLERSAEMWAEESLAVERSAAVDRSIDAQRDRAA